MSDGTSVFLYGTLRYPPLLTLVLGREAAGRLAFAPGNRVIDVGDRNLPALVRAEGHRAEGLLVEGLSAEDVARLDFYELGFGYVLEEIALETAEGPAGAMAYRAESVPGTGTSEWSLERWIPAEAHVTMPAAEEFMSLFGTMSLQEAARSYPTIRLRADSRVRAQAERTPQDLRRGFRDEDVSVAGDDRPYTGYFSLARTQLSHRRFDGGTSRVVTREALMAADAVTVLPYDPVRDRVLVVEQFRFGPFTRGDRTPWTLEPIAGRMDPGETPEDTARREAVEETGLNLGRLYPAGNYYPSPGAFTEYAYSFIGIADLPDGAAGLGGEDGEEEDILGHVITFDRLMELLDSGEADTATLILSALWLARNRDRLRG